MLHNMLKRLSLPRLFKLIPHPYGNKDPIFLCSYPKSGRTWFRFILANYLNAYYALDQELDLQSVFRIVPNHGWDNERGLPAYGYNHNAEIPLFICSHINYDAATFGPYRRIFLLRTVYDVLVSDYFHVSRQRQNFEDNLGTFIREPAGADKLIGYLNSWAPHLLTDQTCVLTYERLSDNTLGEVQKALAFADISMDVHLLEEAIARADFKKMREVELAKGIAGHQYDASDQEARRVRRGVVGGYTDYLSAEDQHYIQHACFTGLTDESLVLLRTYDLLP